MYKIVGADQKEYGPVNEEQIREWIQQGRANGQTLVRAGEGPWKPLSTFPELAAILPPQAAPPPLTNYGAYQGYAPSAPRTNKMAVTGLVLSILGLFQCCTPVFAILGMIFSGIAFYQISRNPQVEEGKGMAIAGIILSVLGLILFVVLLASGIFEELLKNMPNL